LLRDDRTGGLQCLAGELALRSHNLVGEMPLPRDGLVGQMPLLRDSLVGEMPLAGEGSIGKVPLAGENLVGKLLGTRPQFGRVGERAQRGNVWPGGLSSLVAGADRADNCLAAFAHVILALAHPVLTLAELLLAAVNSSKQLVLDFLR
jgi:hypothetical protein